MVDPRARRGFPERWLLPPAPRQEPSASTWAQSSFEDRRRLARTRPASVAELDAPERALVADLAAARLATRWRLLAAAPVLGWLILMTVWGFGRASYPAASDTWLLAGLALGALGWFIAAIAVAARLRRARRTLAAAQDPASGDTSADDTSA